MTLNPHYLWEIKINTCMTIKHAQCVWVENAILAL